MKSDRKRIRGLCLILMVFVCIVMLPTGCSQNASVAKDQADTGKKDKTKAEEIIDKHSNDGHDIVGISMPSQSLERWNRDGHFLKQQFENSGYEVILTFADDLIDKQIHQIESMIKKHVDIILISAIDASSLTRVLEQAKAANVAVICYDRLILKSDVVDYYVSFDNYRVGQLQGEYIVDALDLAHAGDKTYHIEITSGDSADNNARYYYKGMFDQIKPYIDQGVLVVPSGQTGYFETAISSWSSELAEVRFSGILNSYYLDGKSLDCAVCVNDSTAFGVSAAIEKDYHQGNPVIVTGQDGDEANLKNIMEGKQTMTVFKALSNEALVALEVGRALMEGKTPDESLIEAAGWDFHCRCDKESYDNGVKKVTSFLLKPETITKDNMMEKLVDKGYYKVGKDGYLKAVTK